MLRRNRSIVMLAVASVFTAAPLTACDDPEGPNLDRIGDIGDVDRIGDVAVITDALDSVDAATPSQTPAQHPNSGHVEYFYFSTAEDTIATTMATGGLMAPFPAGIPTLDEPAIDTGVLIAIKIYDEDHNLVGFGTEQEVVDMQNASSETTFTMTLPGRGTLMLKQTEDFTAPFEEINDMVADQEFIRVFDPPLVYTTTVPHTGRIVGGSGEFAGAKGKMSETDIVYGINLIDQQLDVADVIRVKFN